MKQSLGRSKRRLSEQESVSESLTERDRCPKELLKAVSVQNRVFHISFPFVCENQFGFLSEELCQVSSKLVC